MQTLPPWSFATFLALLLWGITGVTQKLATNRISSERAFIWFSLAMSAVSAVLVLTQPIRWTASLATIVLAIGAGVLNGAGVLTSFAALESGGKASVVVPLIALYPLITVSGAMVFLHEHLSHMQRIGAALAVIAAVLLAIEPESDGTHTIS